MHEISFFFFSQVIVVVHFDLPSVMLRDWRRSWSLFYWRFLPTLGWCSSLSSGGGICQKIQRHTSVPTWARRWQMEQVACSLNLCRRRQREKKKKKKKKAEEKISYEIRTWKRKCNGFTQAWTPAQKLSKINLNLYVWHICELFARGRWRQKKSCRESI